MIQLKRGTSWLFHWLVIGYAVVLLWGVFAVQAQSSPQLQELQHRVTSLEELQLDHRLTVIETILRDLQSSSLWHQLTMGGTGLLLGERAIAVLRRKKGEEEE